jgi:hypothetical protein
MLYWLTLPQKQNVALPQKTILAVKVSSSRLEGKSQQNVWCMSLSWAVTCYKICCLQLLNYVSTEFCGMFNSQAACLVDFIPLVNHFCWQIFSKHCTISPLHCNHMPRLMKPHQALTFYYLRHHFDNCESRASGGKMWNSSGRNYILGHVTYSNAFSFLSSALQSWELLQYSSIYFMHTRCI